MPTPVYVGLTDTYTVSSIEPFVDRQGFDTLIVRLRGKSTALTANLADWSRGDTYPGYPNVSLETKRSSQSRGIGEIELSFSGFIESGDPENGLIDVVDEITEQTVALTSDAGENVQFQYHAQQTTSRWLHRGAAQPRSPKFKGVVSSDVNVLTLFNPQPPDFSGSVKANSKKVGRLVQFTRTRLSPNVWGVIETWQNRIEPNIEIS